LTKLSASKQSEFSNVSANAIKISLHGGIGSLCSGNFDISRSAIPSVWVPTFLLSTVAMQEWRRLS